jgi:nucleoside-diphosphate-sugar epimerase
MKKILVTGSNGFIGRALVKRLSGLGFAIIGFDIADGDIAEEGSLAHLENEDISYVFHLAGKTFIPESWVHPFNFYRTNVLGTANILEFCRKTGAGLTYVSSYLYGKPEYLPVDEKHPVKAYNPYSHTKLVAEEICRYYRDQFNLGISILRPFNAYGPGQSEQFLIPELIRKMLDPQITFIEVMDLRPKRDFVFIDDLVEALFLSMDGPRGIYNVGSGSSVSVEEVINNIKELTGIQKNVLTRKVERPMEIFDLYADVTKISASLKWKMNVSFKEGLARCIEEYPATKENS